MPWLIPSLNLWTCFECSFNCFECSSFVTCGLQQDRHVCITFLQYLRRCLGFVEERDKRNYGAPRLFDRVFVLRRKWGPTVLRRAPVWESAESRRYPDPECSRQQANRREVRQW